MVRLDSLITAGALYDLHSICGVRHDSEVVKQSLTSNTAIRHHETVCLPLTCRIPSTQPLRAAHPELFFVHLTKSHVQVGT